MPETPFPLRAVLPICVNATRWLRSKEDREDAIQDALEAILQIDFTGKSEDNIRALIYKITTFRAIDISRRHQVYAKYFNQYKYVDSVTGSVQDSNCPHDYQWFPEPLCWNNRDREEAEELVYRRQIARHFFKELKDLTPKQNAMIMLLMMGCTRQEVCWIIGYGYQVTGGKMLEGARKNLLDSISPQLRKELESSFRGNGRNTHYGFKRRQRRFWQDKKGVWRYARPGSHAHKVYESTEENNPIKLGQLVEKELANEKKERLLPNTETSNRVLAGACS